MIHLSAAEIMRYNQQIKLPQIGISGQTKIKNIKILCVGAGGLGTPLLLYLAAMGVGTLGVVDDDRVSLSNLQRQILYQEKQLGREKVFCVKQQLHELNSSLEIKAIAEKINANNIVSLIQQYDIIADCSDNFSTRYLLNDYCFYLDKPLITASVFQFQGQCILLEGRRGPCLRCLYPDTEQSNGPNCAEEGVLGVVPGLLGTIQAAEMIKWTLGLGESLAGRLLTVNVLNMEFRVFQLDKNPACTLCASSGMIAMQKDPLYQFCQKASTMEHFLISPKELQELLKNQNDLQLIDVRTPEKHADYNIGGKSLPFDELRERYQELDPNSKIVLYCTSGGRSMMALQFLIEMGFTNVQSLDGGVTAWRT